MKENRYFLLSEYNYYVSPTSLKEEEDDGLDIDDSTLDEPVNMEDEESSSIEDELDVSSEPEEESGDVEVIDKSGKEIQIDVTDLVTKTDELSQKIDQIISGEQQDKKTVDTLEKNFEDLNQNMAQSFEDIMKNMTSRFEQIEQEMKKRVPTKEEELYNRLDKSSYNIKLTDYFEDMVSKKKDKNYLTLQDIENYDESFIKKSLQ